jgi:hypothetical protein
MLCDLTLIKKHADKVAQIARPRLNSSVVAQASRWERALMRLKFAAELATDVYTLAEHDLEDEYDHEDN